MKCCSVLLTVCVLSLPAVAPGQKGTRTPPPSSLPTSPGTNNGASSNSSNNSRPTTLPPSLQQQIYVTGKVMVEDGSELPANVVIQKICGSQRQSIGYADQKGNFNVKLSGSSMASLLDASDDSPNSRGMLSTSQGQVSLVGCEVQASYAGYRSQTVNIGSQHVLDNPNIGVIIIKRMSGGGSGTSVSETLRTAPKNALKAYEHGLEAIRKGKPEAAQRDFEKAVELHPTFANAWYELGHLQMAGDQALAQADLEKALSSDPKYVPPYADLAFLAFRNKQWPETVSITDRALRLDASSFPELYYFSGIAQYNLRNFKEAEKRAREAVKADVDHTVPRSNQLLGYVLANKGDFAGAAEQIRIYIASAPSPDEAAKARKDLARIESKINETANR